VSASKRAAKSKVIGAPGIGTCWLGNLPVFAFGDGTLLIGEKSYTPHDGGIISLALHPTGQSVITAGEDGFIKSTDAKGTSHVFWSRLNAWFDALLTNSTTNDLAFICGREVMLLNLANLSESARTFKPGRTPNSLAFNDNATLLAIGHSAGVSLFETNNPAAPLYEFPCSGGPVSVALDPTGSFLFAGLSEPALAGWRLGDGQGFRMGGYPGKPKQLIFSDGGKVLFTSGGPALLVWPMVAQDGTTLSGPMGQAAAVYRPRLGLATAVASHTDIAIVGWSDGGVDMINLLHGGSRHLGGPRPQSDLDKDPRALTTAIIGVSLRADGKQACWIGEQGAYGSCALQ
jgi:hypothetical protein